MPQELIDYAGYDCLDSALTLNQINDIHWKLELSPDPIVCQTILKVRTRLKQLTELPPAVKRWH